MLSVEVIKPGMFTTIQDGGRSGYAFYGIPSSGYMDREAAHIANVLVGNKKNASLLEMTFVGGTFAFNEDCVIAITGADMQPRLNEQACKMYQTILVSKGDTLRFKNAISGVRSYVAIKGKWKIPKVYGSTATYTYGELGGMEGRRLVGGDLINIKINADVTKVPIVIWPNRTDYKTISKIKVTAGPEFSYLKNGQLLFSTYKKSPSSDRMGSILDGGILDIQLQDAFASKFLFPGMIQCTPSGKLIVVLQDGQTTGGYPRVGIISRKELHRFNQLQPGMSFTFVQS